MSPVHALIEDGIVWYGMVEVCKGAPMDMGCWVLNDRHDLAPCVANNLL